MRRAVILGELDLLVRTRRADHRRAEVLRPLAGDQANAAGRGVEQQDRVGADLVGLAQQIAHRHALQHHRGRRFIGDPVGQLHGTVGRHQALLRVGAHGIGVGDAVARLELSYATADIRDFTGAFHAHHGGQVRQGIEAAALIGIDIVEAHGVVLDADLAGARLADVDVLPLEFFGSAMLVDADCFDHYDPVP